MGDSQDRAGTAQPAGSTATIVDVLRSSGSDFELLVHPQTFTAAAEAHALGVLEQDVAKTLVVRDDRGVHIRAVVPASRRLDLDKLAREAGAEEVTLLAEPELQGAYPQFELGAVPPFSGPADTVVVDRHLVDSDQVVFEAGAHDTSIRIRTEDLLAVAGARVADIVLD
jgi:Ala-tRNA(Pro) deacylase